MIFRRLADAPGTHRALLRCASWLVPARQRREWRAEWRAELWHVHHERQLFAAGETDAEDALAFCLGAFPDAFWLRRHTPPNPQPFHADTARRCWLTLATAAAAATLLAVLLPGPRNAMLQAAYVNNNSVVEIVPQGAYTTGAPGIAFAHYTSWVHREQRLFTGLAFFARTSGTLDQVTLRDLKPTGRPAAERSLGIASSNFFDLLQVPLQLSDFSHARQLGLPAAVLSEETWRRDFGSNPYVIGDPIRIDGRDAILSGVIADNAWAFPGRNTQIWLLEDEAALSQLPPATMGFAFASLNPIALTNNPGLHINRWQVDVPVHTDAHAMGSEQCIGAPSWLWPCRNVGDVDSYDCIYLDTTISRPSSLFFAVLMLALLSLPATIPLSFGDEPLVSESLFAAARWRRWGFLVAKFAVIVPLVYCGSLDIAYGHTLSSNTAEYIQWLASFPTCLILFRWALYDQRKRCPVCLRLLTNPVRVGEPSRNFLAWSGTEMICSRGHGLMHTPALPTTWFGARRWLHLDPSWKPLFPDAVPGGF